LAVASIGASFSEGNEMSGDSVVAASYERCRDLNRRHGRTYYLATHLLPAWKRRHVHALYGFTRFADDIVDHASDPAASAARLAAWSDRFRDGYAGEPVDDPLLPAVLHTIRVFALDPVDFDVFLKCMAADLTVSQYATYDDLLGYMEGSAAAIGTMMLPILGTDDPARAREPARQLGLAFQLTNFVRDVAEDLDRGRVYLPQADLARFGLDRGDLYAARANRHATDALKALVAYEIDRARGHYAEAAKGIALLHRSSRTCIRAAFTIYGAILTEIERRDCDVFAGRAVVPTAKRIALAARCLSTRTAVV
jgi:15-cis-phytoene synthase